MRWLTAVVRALGPRRAPLPTGVVLLWISAFVLAVAAALVFSPTECYQSTTMPCRWPSTQLLVPLGTAAAVVVAACLATRSAFRSHRGRAERHDWTSLGWIVPAAVAVFLVAVVRSLD